MSSTTIQTSTTGQAAGQAHHSAPRAARRGLRVLSAIVTALVSVIAALTIVLAVVSHFSPQGQYTVFGHPVMTVLSGSMTPVIRTGDLIVDDPVTAAQAQHLQVGQIVSFREAPGSTAIITHRIVAVDSRDGQVSYVTKGDANNAADTMPRPAADAVGVFRYDIPRGGYLLAGLHRPLVLGLLAASLVLFFSAGPLFRLAARTDEQPERPRPARARHERRP
jgi:signal peptidase I